MRISDLAEVTEIPIATLKDLRHRAILELATGGWPDDRKEIRRWAKFSVPAVMYLLGAKQVRDEYGLTWQDAITFARTALEKIQISIEGEGFARAADLRRVEREIWAGRLDFESANPTLPTGWNYFCGDIAELHLQMERIKHLNAKPARGCLMINATLLCCLFWERAKLHVALRHLENR